MRRIIITFFLFVPIQLLAQTFYITPHLGVNLVSARWKIAPATSHPIGKTISWYPSLGTAIHYKTHRWDYSAGIQLGGVGYGLQQYNAVSPTQKFSSYRGQGFGEGTLLFPFETAYTIGTWKNRISLSILGNLAPVFVLGGPYKGGGMGSPSGENYLYSDFTFSRKRGVSAGIGTQFSLLKNGIEQWSVAVVYNRGLTNLLNVDVGYKYAGQPFNAQAASRGSFFSVQIRKPILLYESSKAKQERTLLLLHDTTQHPPVKRLNDWHSGQFRWFAKGMYFPGTVETQWNVDAGIQYMLGRRLGVNLGYFGYDFIYRLSGKHHVQEYVYGGITRYFKGQYLNPFLAVNVGYSLQKKKKGWFPGLEAGASLKLTEKSRLDVSTRVQYIRSLIQWQWIPLNIGYSRTLGKFL